MKGLRYLREVEKIQPSVQLIDLRILLPSSKLSYLCQISFER